MGRVRRAYGPGVFCALNSALRRQRRRLVTLLAVLTLAGAVVAVHSTTSHDHLGDVVVTCLAAAETAVVAVGAALTLAAHMRRPLWLVAAAQLPELAFSPGPLGGQARAGPSAAGLPAVSSSA